MKLTCGILMAILAAHAVCGVKCLAESAYAAAQVAPAQGEPPCHHHSNRPEKPQPSRSMTNACYPGSFLQGKMAACDKLLLWASIAPAEPPAVVQFHHFPAEPFTPPKLHAGAPPSPALPALRI